MNRARNRFRVAGSVVQRRIRSAIETMFTADSFMFIDDVTAYINNPRITQSIADHAIMCHSVRIFADFGVENA
jgi:hypothetical protein